MLTVNLYQPFMRSFFCLGNYAVHQRVQIRCDGDLATVIANVKKIKDLIRKESFDCAAAFEFSGCLAKDYNKENFKASWEAKQLAFTLASTGDFDKQQGKDSSCITFSSGGTYCVPKDHNDYGWLSNYDNLKIYPVFFENATKVKLYAGFPWLFNTYMILKFVELVSDNFFLIDEV